MQFQPKTEEEIKTANLAPEGEYDFEVLGAEDATSRSGNAMIKIKLGVYNGDAVRWHITDYLLGAMEAKLRHFCDSVGLLKEYEAGTLNSHDCKGRVGKVRLVIEEDDNGKYPPKNSVKDYVCRKAKAIAPAAPVKPAEPEDDVPF